MENQNNPVNAVVARQEKRTNRMVTVCGIILCLCAVAEFIIWITDTARQHMIHEELMGIGFLALTVGVLWYLPLRSKGRVAQAGLWTGIVAAVALFFVGMCIS